MVCWRYLSIGGHSMRRTAIMALVAMSILISAAPGRAEDPAPLPAPVPDLKAEEAEQPPDPAEQRTQAHVDLAREYFRAALYEDSIKELRAAYDLSHRPVYL